MIIWRLVPKLVANDANHDHMLIVVLIIVLIVVLIVAANHGNHGGDRDYNRANRACTYM